MKVLLLAPHPFYQERGTPIAVDLLIRVLSERGDEVDVVTFPEGEDRQYPRVRIHRVRPWPKMQGVQPGFSLKKLWCDVFVGWRFARLLFTKQYDLVHAVEESAFMAMMLCPLKRVPFVYDMDSSMVTQLLDKFPALNGVKAPLRWLESLPMRYARAVIPVCDALAHDVRRYRQNNIVIIKDVSLVQGHAPEPSQISDIRAEYGFDDKMAMYIGNLESYQGIDLMLEGFAAAVTRGLTAHLVIIGGADQHIAYYREKAEKLGVAGQIHFLGKKPVAHIGAYMAQADLLVSPRTQGVNTPMKVYSYLHSGVPVLATALPTHTQVMNDDIAVLTDPTPEAMAEAMQSVLNDPDKAQRLAQNAKAYIEREHSYDAFKHQLTGLYQQLEQNMAGRTG